jgi:hypothetical protein
MVYKMLIMQLGKQILGGNNWFINVEYAKLICGMNTEFIEIMTTKKDIIVLPTGKDIIAIQKKINRNFQRT